MKRYDNWEDYSIRRVQKYTLIHLSHMIICHIWDESRRRQIWFEVSPRPSTKIFAYVTKLLHKICLYFNLENTEFKCFCTTSNEHIGNLEYWYLAHWPIPRKEFKRIQETLKWPGNMNDREQNHLQNKWWRKEKGLA